MSSNARVSGVRRHGWSVAAAFLAFAMFAAACSSDDEAAPAAAAPATTAAPAAPAETAAPAAPEERTKVRALLIPARATIYVAKAMGFYEDEGLDVEYFAAGAEMGSGVIAAIEAGHVETGNFIAYPTLAIAVANGAKVKGVLSGYVPRPGRDAFQVSRFYVNEESDIHTAADLCGKTVGLWGVTSYAAYMLDSWLAKEGVTCDINKIVVPVSSLVEAIFTGEADAVSLFDILYAAMEERGGGRLLFDDTDAAVPADRLAVITIFSDEYMAKEPEAVAAWVRAEKRAQKFMQDNPEETVQIILDEIERDTSNIPQATYALPSCLDVDAATEWTTFLGDFYPEVQPETGAKSITNAFNADC